MSTGQWWLVGLLSVAVLLRVLHVRGIWTWHIRASIERIDRNRDDK